MKKQFFGLLLLTFGVLSLHAIEIPVSITMDESLPYQKELRYDVVRAITEVENVKIVEPGDMDWIRLYVLSYEMKLENQVSVGYAISYSIVEVPRYLHSYIFDHLDQEDRQEGLERLIPRTVFYHGADLMTVGTEGLETAAQRISTYLKKFLDMRIHTEE